MIKVFKFGGASVRDADAVKNVAKVMNLYPDDRIAVIVSAMGKTTNALERLLHEWYYETGKTESELSGIVSYHLDVARELFPSGDHAVYSELDALFTELSDRLGTTASDNFDYEYDQVVSLGEVFSSKIVSAYLSDSGIANRWIDARSIIRTDNTYRDARVDWEKTGELVNEAMDFNTARVYLTQGFIGATAENLSTTLGREGSDYSAAIVAWCLDAELVAIWKDVPGVLNADPKYFDNTVKLDRLSYYDAIELAYYGASVIHPKTIKPLQNKQIPLWVKSFLKPAEKGTIVHHDRAELVVPSFIFKMNQTLITVSTRDFSFIVEKNLGDIFYEIDHIRLKINVMQNTALSFSFSVDTDDRKVPELIKVLEQDYDVRYNTGLELVTIRHYDQETIDRVTAGKEILLEEKSRHTCQMVMRDLAVLCD